MHPEAGAPFLTQREAKGCPMGEDSVAVLSLSISLCPGNAKLWQGASLPPTASSCESGFPIQAIYMVFWPLCDQALANYLLPGGQNPGFSIQYWNQLAGEKNILQRCCEGKKKKKKKRGLEAFSLQNPRCLMACHSPVFYCFLGM